MFIVFKIFKTKNVNQCKSLSKMSHFFQFICWSRKRDESIKIKMTKKTFTGKRLFEKKEMRKR